MTFEKSYLTREKVCIAILNYNGQKHLKTFLPDVINAVENTEVICVIDNGSTDDSVDFLQSNYPEIQLIQLAKNYGFAGGYNVGLENIQSEYYLLLNSDVSPEPGFLEKMLRHLDENEGVAAVQPTILSYESKEFYEYAGAAGGMMDLFRYPFCRGRILNHVEPFNPELKNAEVFWATGACVLVRSKVFEVLGGFADYYFAHCEEIDLCWRIKRLGYAVEVLVDAKVYHLGGGTLSYNSPRKTYLNFRNSLFTLMRNERLRNLIWLLPSRLLLDIVACCMFFVKGERKNATAVIRARLSYFGKLSQLFKERRKLKNLISKNKIGDSREGIGIRARSIIFYYYVLSKRKYSEIFKT